MKAQKFILVIAVLSCQLTSAFNMEDVEDAIKKNRIKVVKEFVETRALSDQMKQQLLEFANQNINIKKAKLDNFSHNVGLKRKLAGIAWSCGATVQLFQLKLSGFLNLFIGTALYKWGQNAERHKSIEGKVHRIEKYQDALAIKQLIEQASMANKASDTQASK